MRDKTCSVALSRPLPGVSDEEACSHPSLQKTMSRSLYIHIYTEGLHNNNGEENGSYFDITGYTYMYIYIYTCIEGFPQLWVPMWGVPMIRIRILWALY